MPIYHFDLMKGDRLVQDDEGQDLPNIEAAKAEAVGSARELIADAAKQGILATGTVFRIRNEAGDLLAMIPFKNALEPD